MPGPPVRRRETNVVRFRYLLQRTLVAPVESVLLQLPRALVVSVLAAALDCGILVLLVELGGCHPALAAVAGYLAGGVVQYVLCAVWVFPASPSNNAVGFVAFTVLSLGGLAITWAVMALMYDLGHLPYPLAKLFALGLAFNWNFFSRKCLLFTRPGRPAPAVLSATAPRNQPVHPRPAGGRPTPAEVAG
jgi:putative flippase GtrA